MASVLRETLPVNDEVLQLRELYPGLSIEVYEQLYSRYGGSAESAINRIMDDMGSAGYEDITSLVESLTVNKENETEEEKSDSPEWQAVRNPRRPGSDVANKVPSSAIYSEEVKDSTRCTEIRLKKVPPGLTFEQAKANLALCTDPDALKLLRDVSSDIHPKLMIIMRGVPGSGKSTLANILVSVTDHGIICSADSYFTRPNGDYRFNRNLLHEAHGQCQDNCRRGIIKGCSPIIIDNTNIVLKDFEYYVKLAIQHNYAIRIVEPYTSWKSNPAELFRKCRHNVDKKKIVEMAARYEHVIERTLIANVLKKMGPAGNNYNPEKRANTQNIDEMSIPLYPSSVVQPAPVKLDLSIPESLLMSPCKKSPPLPCLSDQVQEEVRNARQMALASPSKEEGTLDNFNDAGKCETVAVPSRMGAIFPTCGNMACGNTATESSGVIHRAGGSSSESLKDKNILFPTDINRSSNRKKNRRSSNVLMRLGSIEKSVTETEEYPPLPQSPSTSVDLGDNSKQLLNAFPQCRKEDLLHFFRMCQENIDDTISLLLDSGYEMTGDPDVRRNSESTSSNPSGPSDDGAPDKEDSDHQSTSSRTSFELPNSDGVNIQGGSSCSYASSSTGSYPGCPSETDDFSLVPVDGADWIDVQLPIDIVDTVAEMYGGDINGKYPSQLTDEERKVRIPPTMAFEIYKYLVLNVSRLENEKREAEGLAAGAVVHDQSAMTRIATEQDAEVDSELEEDELQEILRQIEKIDRESLARDGTQNFIDIMNNDAFRASFEAKRMEKLKMIKRNMAQQIKFAQLKLAFPTLKSNCVDDVFVQSDLDYDRALSALKEVYPSKFVVNSQSRSVEPNACISDPPEEKELMYDPDAVATMSATEKREMIDLADKWKILFEERTSLYLQCKQKAEQHRGRPEIYSYYMLRATDTKNLIKEAQKEYSFYTVISLNAGNGNPNKLDLHGLTVQHAIEVVSKYLQNRSLWVRSNVRSGNTVPLNIITGIGKHSRDNIPKINPAVRNYLRSNHFSYSDQGGSFLVHLSNMKNSKKH